MSAPDLPGPAGASPLLIVTRPLAQALPWVAELEAAGCRARALPLIQIAAADDPLPLRQAWAQLAAQRVVMFVSANAVQAFFAERPLGPHWPPGVWAACSGPGTAQALHRAGVPLQQLVQPAEDAPSLDSESLWPELCKRVPDWVGQPVLLVRGQDGRDWLAQQLIGQGARPQVLQAYRRLLPALDEAQQALLQAAQKFPRQHRWLFSASQAIEHLQQLAPRARWQHSSAWVTHTRIEQAARRAGFGRVCLIGIGLDAVQQQLRLETSAAAHVADSAGTAR